MKTATDTFLNPFDVDMHRLEWEWWRQTKLYRKYAKLLADAKLAYMEAKRVLDVTTAEVDLKVRRMPKKFGIEKAAEKAYTHAVEIDARVIKATIAVNEARHAVDINEAAVNALDHKKRALENLVTLDGRNYFSSPSKKKGRGESVD